MKSARTVFVIVSLLVSLGCQQGGPDVFLVTEYGAVADTSILSTEAIQAAIDAAHQAGGGKVKVPYGMFKTGSLVLKSGVNLVVEEGATLYGSTSLDDYQPMETDYVSLRTGEPTIQLIYAEDASRVSITGTGTIDGQGAVFAKKGDHDEGIGRPHLLRFITCRNVLLSDITLRNAGCWMQHYLACDSVVIDNITVWNHANYNNDGIDIDGCLQVRIRNCRVDSDDDGIVLKSTSARLCEDVVVENCQIASHCNALKLGTESNGGFRNIRFLNNQVRSSQNDSSKYYGLLHGISSLSLEMVDGGLLEDVVVDGLKALGPEVPLFIRLGARNRPFRAGQEIASPGQIEGVVLKNVQAEGGTTGSSITGLPDQPIRSVTLENVQLIHGGGFTARVDDWDFSRFRKRYPEATMFGKLPAAGLFVLHVDSLHFREVDIRLREPDSRYGLIFEQVDALESEGLWLNGEEAVLSELNQGIWVVE